MTQAPLPSSGQFHALRLRPGENFVDGLRAAFAASGATAMAVVTAVGSLSRVQLRFAGQDKAVTLQGPFEIIALSGTIDPRHQHLHLSLADGQGRTIGGHLLAEGSEVYTTVELVLLSLPDLRFDRAPCAQSGYPELVITPQPITGP